MAVLGVGSGPIGLVAALRFKIIDSQPDSSNMGPVPTVFHDFRLFQKLAWLSGPLFIVFSAGIKKMRDEKLCRFVVVSPREVPSLPVSCPFKILMFRSLLNVRSLFRS